MSIWSALMCEPTCWLWMLNFVWIWNIVRRTGGEPCWDWLALSSSHALMFQVLLPFWHGYLWISMRTERRRCSPPLSSVFRTIVFCPTCMQLSHKWSLSIPYLLQFAAMTTKLLSICNCISVYSWHHLPRFDDDIAWWTRSRFFPCNVVQLPPYVAVWKLPPRDYLPQWACRVALSWNFSQRCRELRWNMLNFAWECSKESIACGMCKEIHKVEELEWNRMHHWRANDDCKLNNLSSLKEWNRDSPSDFRW